MANLDFQGKQDAMFAFDEQRMIDFQEVMDLIQEYDKIAQCTSVTISTPSGDVTLSTAEGEAVRDTQLAALQTDIEAKIASFESLCKSVNFTTT